MSVLGKGSREMNAIHLMKTYCLPTLTYGIENAAICDNTKHKMQVIWNNCFRHIFSCCWRETVKPLQYFYNIPTTVICCWPEQTTFLEKMFTNDDFAFLIMIALLLLV